MKTLHYTEYQGMAKVSESRVALVIRIGFRV